MKIDISYQHIVMILTVLAFSAGIFLQVKSAVGQDRQQSMLRAAQDFLDGLNEEKTTMAVYPMDSSERFDWHYFPKSRNGIPLKAMSAEQDKAAYNLMRSGLSRHGFEKATGIIELEGILGWLEGRSPNDSHRDPERYFWTIFGNPADSSPWGWRVEGHHLSLNFTMVPGENPSFTPAFLGTDPATVPRGDRKGWTIQDEEENLARRFVTDMSDSQQEQAIIDRYAPRDILTRARRSIQMDDPTGISYSNLTEEQQTTFLALLDVYLGSFREEISASRMEEFREHGLDDLYFAWAGGLKPGEGHYYRIQGSSLLIEYDNTQDDANHIHTVIRDPRNDFGRDLLEEHYQTSEHHRDEPSHTGYAGHNSSNQIHN